MSDQNKEETFILSLNDGISRYRKHARRNYSGAYTCYVIAIVASALATLSASLDLLPKSLLAALTALPGAVLLFNSILVLEAKTRWYWTKARFYDGLLHRIQYEDCQLAQASKDKRVFDERMEAEYPKFGMLPAQGQKS
jgi:hypothetical protein